MFWYNISLLHWNILYVIINMYTFNFYVTTNDVDAHGKNCITEEEREKFKDFKFVPNPAENIINTTPISAT